MKFEKLLFYLLTIADLISKNLLIMDSTQINFKLKFTVYYL